MLFQITNKKKITFHLNRSTLLFISTFWWRNHFSVFSCYVMYRWHFVVFPLFSLLLFLLPVFLLHTVIWDEQKRRQREVKSCHIHAE